MTVSISDLTSMSSANSTSTTSSTDTSSFSLEDFFSLLITELQNQDPTDPMNTSDMVNQMVQMQTITEMASMTTAVEEMSSNTEQATASSLLGKMVIYSDSASGSSIAAQVEALQYTSASGIVLEMASGDEITLKDITFVYNRVDEATTISTDQKLSATSYLGKTVTYIDETSGSAVEGVVQELIFDGTDVYIDLGTTNGSSVPLSDVTNVVNTTTNSADQKLSATSYLGKTISYIDATSGSSIDGIVNSIIFDGSDIYFDLGTTTGSSVPLSDVLSISNGS